MSIPRASMNSWRIASVADDGVKVFVPCDTTARSVGADAVATEIRAAAADRGVSVELIRNGSRGLYWLEPMVEVDVAGERRAYGPIVPADVPSLFESNFLTGGEHPKALGATEAIPYLAAQTRLTFARVGVIDPRSLDWSPLMREEIADYDGQGEVVLSDIAKQAVAQLAKEQRSTS